MAEVFTVNLVNVSDMDRIQVGAVRSYILFFYFSHGKEMGAHLKRRTQSSSSFLHYDNADVLQIYLQLNNVHVLARLFDTFILLERFTFTADGKRQTQVENFSE